MNIYSVDESTISITVQPSHWGLMQLQWILILYETHHSDNTKNTAHVEEKQLKETVGFKAGKRKNAGMFGREERQQNNRRKPEEKRDRLRQREGETMVIIVSLTQLNPLLSFTIQRKKS